MAEQTGQQSEGFKCQPGIFGFPDIDEVLQDLKDLDALSQGEEVLVLSQGSEQSQDEDLTSLGCQRMDVKVTNHIQLHLRPAAVTVLGAHKT